MAGRDDEDGTRETAAAEGGGRLRRAGQWMEKRARRLDSSAGLLTAAKLARELLPGDSDFGDPLSTAGRRQPQAVGRQLSKLTAERPGVLREAGLSALQVWEALSEAQGRGQGKREIAVMFTDLVEFSDWALEAGDDRALELLRDVDGVLDPAVRGHGGEVVKRLGDGMMAVFGEPSGALDALVEAHTALARVDVAGYAPRLRSGIHVGRPRKIGGDYLGIDVNIAARLTEQADADEIMVSDRALARLETDGLRVRRKRGFKVKGVPRDLDAYVVRQRG